MTLLDELTEIGSEVGRRLADLVDEVRADDGLVSTAKHLNSMRHDELASLLLGAVLVLDETEVFDP